MANAIRNRKQLQKKLIGTLTDKKGTWANDPVFLKKTEEAKEFIKKHGLPKELAKRKSRRK